MRRVGTGAWLTWSAAVVAACASTTPTAAPAPSKWGTQSDAVVARSDAESATLRPVQVLPTVAGDVVYTPWDESSPTEVRARWATGGDGLWNVTWVLSKPGDRPATVREDQYRVQNGQLLQLSNVDHAEKVQTVFDPPLVVLPATLAVGQTVSQTTRMTVHPLDNPSKKKAAGSASQDVTYQGDQRIRTPAGEWVARHVQTIFTADLSGPKVRNQTDQWYVDGVGLVAQKRSERTTLMGVPVRSADEAWVAMSIGGMGPGR